MRRVRAPFSVLASRSHSFSLVQASTFNNGITFSADVTVLANWVLSESELEVLRIAKNQRAIVVDCDSPDLLGNDLYREQIALATMVTVPNNWMKEAVHALNPNVWVIPSCVDLDHFLLANKVKLDVHRPLCIGCLGQYDWYIVRDAILSLLKKYERLTVIAGPEAFRSLPKHPRILGIEVTVQNIAEIMRNTHLGLCPIDGERGYDDIWRHEYGALCRPALALTSSDPKVWVERTQALLFDQKLRAERGREAFEEANSRRATKMADKYLATYRKRLPHLLFS